MCRTVLPCVALLGLLALAASMRSATTYADNPSTQHQGVVVSAGGGKLIMKGTDGTEHSHDVAANATVRVDGKPAHLEDLKLGDKITVTLDGSGIATMIVCMRT